MLVDVEQGSFCGGSKDLVADADGVRDGLSVGDGGGDDVTEADSAVDAVSEGVEVADGGVLKDTVPVDVLDAVGVALLLPLVVGVADCDRIAAQYGLRTATVLAGHVEMLVRTLLPPARLRKVRPVSAVKPPGMAPVT